MSDITSIVPVISDGQNSYLVTTSNNKQHILDAETFKRIMSISPDLLAALCSENNTSRLAASASRSWLDNGWLPALEFLMATIDMTYADIEDSSASIRNDLLSQYRQTLPEPERLSPQALNNRRLEFSGTFPKFTTSHLLSRRTTRIFSTEPITYNSFAQMVVTGLKFVQVAAIRRQEDTREVDLLVSYGGAFRFYIVIFNVENLQPGVYEYYPSDQGLHCLKLGCYRNEVSDLLMQQPAPLSGAYSMFLVADYDWHMWRYRHSRALRNLYCDAGRIAQQLILAGLPLTIDAFSTPAIKDSAAAELLMLEDSIRYNAVYSITFGKKYIPPPSL